ncbi:MAG: hypothetical protein JJU02_00535 [Cryomorphaceae bacterium]|nr:hypothetical protein [Cryomorphaceae bacterium]
MISIKIEGIFEPEQVKIQKSIDKEDFGRKGLFRADSIFKIIVRNQKISGDFLFLEVEIKKIMPKFLFASFTDL